MSEFPRSLCIVRLSALGDVSHVLPIIHTIKVHHPNTAITWVIGRVEHKLVGHLEGVEFILFDKAAGWREYFRVRQLLAGRVFDALLLMQVSMRANFLSLCIGAKRKLGYDSARSKDLHGLFVSERIAPGDQQHVIDSFFGFLQKLGLEEKVLDWSLPEVDGANGLAEGIVDGRPLMVISPCSSHVLRNWLVEGYAALADYAATEYDMKVVICGGRSETEAIMAKDIIAAAQTLPLNLVGKDTFPEFIALLRRARVLVSPDSGPSHIAAITDTPVLGLYAASNPKRSGPYKSIHRCVDQYNCAAKTYTGQEAEALKWGKKLEYPGAMSLITIEQAKSALDFILKEDINLMTDIMTPVSPGEIIDKMTILEIKKERIDDEEKVKNVVIELEALEAIWQKSDYAKVALVDSKREELKEINEKLWVIEDDLRVKESRSEFGHDFIQLARSVYFTNDERASIKKEINVAVGSRFVEEKSYQDYNH